MTKCNCDHQETGRCWLNVDSITFEQNFKRLSVGDPLAVYTFAVLEKQRLQQKAYDFIGQGITEIPPDYCCIGTRHETENERITRVLALASG